MNKPFVSIIIPTFKRPQLLRRAIQSCILQNYINFEIIVVDDNDPDSKERSTTEIVLNEFLLDKLISSKIIYLKHSKNLNGSFARNTGFNNSRGELITFLDDDDEFLPNRLTLLVEALSKLPHEYGAIYSGYKKVFHGNIHKNQISKETIEGYVFKYALSRSLYISAGSNLLLRREAINSIGLFDTRFKRNQDLEFLVRLTEKFKIKSFNKTLLIQHIEKSRFKISFYDSIKRENLFQKTFSKKLDYLNDIERSEVLMSWGLDVIKLYISYKKINIIPIMKKYNISVSILLRFLFYILKRIITRKTYGFKI
jgi:glycosyltransferase involved in cell wall biosynthesis